MTQPLPQRIGRYEVVDRLGRGGMGVVYLAKDPMLGRTLAIKMLTEDNEELRERFAREARSAAALDHANIVTVYDVGEDNGHPFIAMKYLDGETMAELIRRRAPIPLGRKLELMSELCAGLGYAHRCGIVHRDIKPANLMITTEGTLKILDFGIARIASDVSHSGLTQIGTVLGSVHYMSPEQADGLQADERSDIFSVSLVFYELLTFERAFPGELGHVILHNIVNKEPRPIREVSPEIDAELEHIVAKGLVKDPQRRYQTLADLAGDLQRFHAHLDAAEKTVIARRDSPGVEEKSKTGGSGGKNIRNRQEIDDRRKALIATHLADASGNLDAGHYEEAINQCEQVLVISPDEPRALDLIERAHRAIDDQHVREWLAEAHTLVARGTITEAERLAGQAIQLQPGSAEGQALVADLKERRKEQELVAERQRSVRAALAKARASFEVGAFEAAVRGASEALAFDAASEEARQLLEKAKAAIDERDARIAQERQATEEIRRSADARHQESDGGLTVAREATRVIHPEPRSSNVAEPVAAAAVWNRKFPMGLAAGVLLFGGLIAAGWWLFGAAPKPEREKSETSNRPAAVDYSPFLADAEGQLASGDILSAVAQARKIPTTAPEYARLPDLLRRIRAAAASQAAAARQTAEAAGAAARDEFRDADGLLKQAEAQPDANAAVSLYDEARQSFVRIANAGLTPAQLMQLSRDAIRHGNSKGAIDYAVQAFSRDSSNKQAIAFLAEQRQQAAVAARTARQRAATEGASIENSAAFKKAWSRESAADGLSAPPDTQKSVDAYRDARKDYDEAYASALNAKLVTDALRRADLEKEQAKAEEAAKTASDAKRRAADLRTQSVSLDDAQAIVLLEQASTLDSTNDDIRTELERRRKNLAAASRSGGAARGDSGINTGRSGGPPALSPTEAVHVALREFAATSKGANNAVWTYTGLPPVTFRSATEAVVLWNVTVIETDAQLRRVQEKRKYECALTQSAQGWKVTAPCTWKGKW